MPTATRRLTATKSSPASRASSPSPPRSPSPTRRAARSATAASTSRTSSATVPFEKVWGLLVDGTLRARPAARRAAPADRPLRRPARRRAGGAGDARARVGLPAADRHLRRAGARRPRPRVGDGAVASSRSPRAAPAARRSRSARSTRRRSIPERFLIRWRGEADPDHVKAIDAYWISAAEHGMNASTFTARVIASTGADVAAALSRRGRRAQRPAARRRALARAEDARRGRGSRRRRHAGSRTRSTAASG